MRRRRYSPPALATFLIASQARANATRAARPDLARQEARWLAAGAGSYVAVRRPDALRWWIAVGLMLDWHLGMVETEDGVARPLGAADAATLVRAWLVPIVARNPSPAALAAGHLSDVADGRLARASAPTRLGRDLEGIADACFAIAALRGLVRDDALSGAAAGAELLRLGTGMAIAAAAWFGAAAPPDPGVLHAARATTPVRALGMFVAARGRRSAGSALVLTGSLASSGLLVGRLPRGDGHTGPGTDGDAERSSRATRGSKFRRSQSFRRAWVRHGGRWP